MWSTKKDKLIIELKYINKGLLSIIESKFSFQWDLLLEQQKTLSSFLNNLKTIMDTLKDIQQQLADLKQSVAQEKVIEQSAVKLIQGFGGIIEDLRQKLTDALANNDGATLALIVDDMKDIKSDIDQQSNELAAAVTANTPATSGAPAEETGGASETKDDQSNNNNDQSSETIEP